MFDIKEYYLGIVGKAPRRTGHFAELVSGIIREVKSRPNSVEKQITCLFFINLFMSARNDFSSHSESERIMAEAVGALKIFASASGCEEVEKLDVIQILAWLVLNVPIA
ncbi:MAG: hypothetical protein WCI41_04135 [bacterium]